MQTAVDYEAAKFKNFEKALKEAIKGAFIVKPEYDETDPYNYPYVEFPDDDCVLTGIVLDLLEECGYKYCDENPAMDYINGDYVLVYCIWFCE